ALGVLPMVAMPSAVAGWVNTLAGITALAVVLFALVGPITDRYGWPRWFAVGVAVPLAGATEPVRETIGFGQVNLILLALIIADLVALRWRGRAALPRAAPGAASHLADRGAQSPGAQSPLGSLRHARLAPPFPP